MSVFKVKSGPKAGQFCAQVVKGYSPTGSRRYVTRYFKTEREAKACERKMLEAQSAGTLVVGERVTVGALATRWLEFKQRRVKASTFTDYSDALQRFIVPMIGKKYLESLRPLELQSFIDTVAEVSSDTHANRVLTRLRMMLKDAVRWQLLGQNPAEHVKPFKIIAKDDDDVKILELHEMAALLDYAKSHRLYAMVYLALMTGLRIAELLGLRWVDVKMAESSLNVVQTAIHTKGKMIMQLNAKTNASSRAIILSSDVISALKQHQERQQVERQGAGEAWQADNGLVFPNQLGGVLDYANARRSLVSLGKRASLSHVGWHMLRHTHASLLIARGASAKAVADRLGHTDEAFTLRTYVHLFASQKKANTLSMADVLQEMGRLESLS
jgi:integrase